MGAVDSNTMSKGIVKFFNHNDGWGFIEFGMKDIFFHQNDFINKKDIENLSGGTEVSFDLSRNKKGKKAINIKRIKGRKKKEGYHSTVQKLNNDFTEKENNKKQMQTWGQARHARWTKKEFNVGHKEPPMIIQPTPTDYKGNVFCEICRKMIKYKESVPVGKLDIVCLACAEKEHKKQLNKSEEDKTKNYQFSNKGEW